MGRLDRGDIVRATRRLASSTQDLVRKAVETSFWTEDCTDAVYDLITTPTELDEVVHATCMRRYKIQDVQFAQFEIWFKSGATVDRGYAAFSKNHWLNHFLTVQKEEAYVLERLRSLRAWLELIESRGFTYTTDTADVQYLLSTIKQEVS